MPTSSIQAQIAFKNLLGKAQSQKNFGPNNENYGYLFNVPSTNVWSSRIPFDDPSTAVNNQIAIKVLVNVTEVSESFTGGKFASYLAVFGPTLSVLSTTKDPKTNQDFEYGKGSLLDIGSGSRIYDFIPDSYGNFYAVKPYTTYPTTEIFPGNERDWIFQYNSGLLYQDNITYSAYEPPTKLVGYYYIGNKLSSLDPTGPALVRVSATGPTDLAYFATTSTPFISTYSSTSLFLVDFYQGNTSSVKLNVNFLGTLSVYKYGASGLGELSSGDIVGGTGSTAGPTYYLTYNSDGFFEFYNSNPVQTPGSFKNLNPIINDVGGIEKSYSFDDVSFQEMFNDLLYPEQLAKLTSLSISNRTLFTSSVPTTYFIDLGRPALGTMTFSWDYINESNFFTNSVEIVDVTNVTTPTANWPAGKSANTSFLLSSKSGTFSFTGNVLSTVPDKRIFYLRADRKNKTRIPKIAEIQWTNRVYYGSTTSTSVNVFGLTSMSNLLATHSVGTYQISGTQGYKYLAFPDTSAYTFTNITHYNLPIPLATQSYTLVDSGNNYMTMSVTNSYNVNSVYRIYRTLNQINGTLSVNITK
jgi:hypothetical protein